MKTCTHHPDRKGFSICHGCGKDYCQECLDEGREFYYCKNPECQKLLKKQLFAGSLQGNVVCPNCESDLELSDKERFSGKVHCPECEALIDYRVTPPGIFNRDHFVELLTSLNQGDIGLVKSILENAGVEYYVLGENFLSVEPLIQPARFYVSQKQFEEVKELLKGYRFSNLGVSNNQSK
ncbi:MAG TPA: hypothetical protein VGB89_12605 [Bacteroidota bacterium]